MSLITHILVLALLLAAYQIAKSENATTTPVPETPEPFSFNHTNGSLTFKISVEKIECVEDKKTVENETETLSTPLPINDLIEGENENELYSAGTEENPAKSCLSLPNSGEFHINPSNRFQVRCELDTEIKSTCLIINDYINTTTLDRSAINLDEEIWLSQTKFDVSSLYNNLDVLQISDILSTSVKVYQKITYYYSTGATDEDTKVKSLQGLLWNDHLVGPEITNKMPISFTVSESYSVDDRKDWVSTDIVFEDMSNKRLPVTDFYIKGVRDKSKLKQLLYFKLRKLCFYHNN